ncbi:hypothetical protein [Rubrolithibacter danxiaensis]|uniref:hypothetical protein n=1 Tax=Rubrolithibacter danxiaensis TaxID=3390805 RepID=UPI003BF8810C
MIIYNKTWLSNLLLINQVEKEFEAGLITNQELRNIKEKYPVGFYSPNLFIRAGLFLLTLIISIFSSGFLSLILADAHVIESYGWLIFLALVHYIALEFLVQTKFHFRSGADDALLWITFGLLTAAFVWAGSNKNADNYLRISGFIFILSAILSLRFSDVLMSAVCCLSCLAFLFFAWQKMGGLGLTTLPFILMFSSGLIYWFVRKNAGSTKTKFYAGSLVVLQAISLITLYLAGNYFFVRELGNMLSGSKNESIPFDWFFWLWTATLPFLYIGFGLLQRNRTLLRTGLLLIAVTAFTIRNYYHLVPLELALSLCGIITLSISYIVINYLRIPRNGFTSAETENPDLIDKLNVESLVISETFSKTGQGSTEESTLFGGGKFGGGGASSGF